MWETSPDVDNEVQEMKVPFVDLRAQYDSIKDEIGEALTCVLNSASFVLGKQVARSSESFATMDRHRNTYTIVLVTTIGWMSFRAQFCALS